MKSALFALSCLLVSASASAALAPWGERSVELVRVIQDPAVSAAAGSTSIDSVRFVSSDLYEVVAGSCTIEVALETIPPPPHIIGARRFTVKVSRTTGCQH